jgi:hypothetical protein
MTFRLGPLRGHARAGMGSRNPRDPVDTSVVRRNCAPSQLGEPLEHFFCLFSVTMSLTQEHHMLV